MRALAFILLAVVSTAATAQLPVPRRPAAPSPTAALAGDSTAVRATRRNPRRTEFVADGAVANSLNSGKGGTPATGALGIRHTAERDVFSALLTIASTADTLAGDGPARFGRALLSPGGSGRGIAASGLLDYQRYWDYGDDRQRLGGHGYASFSQSTWRVERDGVASASDLTVLTAGVRASWIALQEEIDEDGNSFSFTIEAGYTLRAIAGDAADDDDFLRQALGTTRRVFHGPELSFAIQLRQLTASATVPVLGAFGGPKLKGLTGVQPVVGFSINAPIFVF